METQRLVERQRQDAQRVQAIQAQRRDENRCAKGKINVKWKNQDNRLSTASQ